MVTNDAKEPPMQMPRPTEVDKERFKALVPDDPRVEIKPMFGNLAAFVNGNMFMGLFGADIGLKLAEPDQAELRAAGGGPFGPAERPMGGYVSLPDTTSADQVGEWVSRALAHVAAQPPKQAKPSKKSRR
jgi:TfoX/Sxy family transcriptional regulator of competence genes